MDIVAAIDRLGGFASTAQLSDLGFSARHLTRAVREGRVRRPRLGWYSIRPPEDAQFRAVRIGGRLTGISALDAMGAWVLHRSNTIHVAIEPGMSRLRPDPGDVRLHWVEATEPAASPALVGVGDALVQVVLTERLEIAVACLDWALFTNTIDRIDYERILLRLPRGLRPIAGWVDGSSQSVLESVARVRLRQRGWSVRTQVRVGTIGAIDIVVEDHVALELDGREHHESRFEKDRAKDLQITIEGRHSIRVSWRMLRTSWPRVELAIERALAARRLGGAGDSAVPRRIPSGRRRSPRRRERKC